MKENISFEEALKKLEEVVTTLESGVDELEDIVTLFEAGSEAAKLCSKKLEDVENKIEILSNKIN
ncbi:MAG: exodeoxyribonuclease VII small subunit [Candidatus Cloacimonetes bacterium]|nr:exodeoxyribonuclease VII small subunit [Candidatus Cloacimonadota bacterium]